MISPSKVVLQSLTESKRAKGIVKTVMITIKISLLHQTRSLTVTASVCLLTILETSLNCHFQLRLCYFDHKSKHKASGVL